MALSLLAMAPTPGDIGGCGQPPDELDSAIFFSSLAATDCRMCQSCGFATKSCELACGADRGIPPDFPEGCVPLAHDGEVCLRRLQSEDCEAYEPLMRDDEVGAAIPLTLRPRPSECQFCPAGAP